MADKTYLPERQTEYWTSRQIEEFLLDAGFSVIAVPLTQRVEKEIPSDFVFADTSRQKIFGLQYKALYHNGEDHWKLTEHQHEKLKNFDWMYYCTSELKSISDNRAALHFARFYDTNFPYKDKLPFSTSNNRQPYSRWGNFFQRFRDCKLGRKLSSPDEFRDILGSSIELSYVEDFAQTIVDLYFIDLDLKSAIHTSNLMSKNEG